MNSGINDVQSMPWYGWVGLAILLLTQGTWLFLDARKRGAKPWVWGLLGLVQFPCPMLYYWYFVRRPLARRGAAG